MYQIIINMSSICVNHERLMIGYIRDIDICTFLVNMHDVIYYFRIRLLAIFAFNLIKRKIHVDLLHEPFLILVFLAILSIFVYTSQSTLFLLSPLAGQKLGCQYEEQSACNHHLVVFRTGNQYVKSV